MISYASKMKIERNVKMEREVNEEKRKKFIEYAGKRVNNVLHDIQILEPMARSNTYDFTRKDVDDMFTAMQETLNEAKEEFDKKFSEKARAEKKTFSFATEIAETVKPEISPIEENYSEEISTVENRSYTSEASTESATSEMKAF